MTVSKINSTLWLIKFWDLNSKPLDHVYDLHQCLGPSSAWFSDRFCFSDSDQDGFMLVVEFEKCNLSFARLGSVPNPGWAYSQTLGLGMIY